MKTLYLDCFSGISGDMCLGALINAGARPSWLESELLKLPLSGWRMQAFDTCRHGLTGTRLIIEADENSQPCRSFFDIKEMLQGSSLSDKTKVTAMNIFQELAIAEGKVHGVPVEEVHFHEIGAVDSIIDITGTALAIEYLGIDEVVCSPIPTGSGQIMCNHGLLPIPAPATAELLKGIPLSSVDVKGELTTPTGAALAVTLAKSFGPIPEMTVNSIGYGFGSKDYGIPNFLRVFIGSRGEARNSSLRDSVLILEVNIDDMNPQFCGHILDRLYLAGAIEAFITPILMKKNRPAYLITVLARESDKDSLLKILFSETTTLGIRYRVEDRIILKRIIKEVSTPYGVVKVKIALGDSGETLNFGPEYEDCRRLAAEKGVPVKEIYNSALIAFKSSRTD